MDTDNIISESSNGIGMLLFIIVVLDVITEGGDVGGVSVIMVALVISRLLSPGKNSQPNIGP